MENPARSAAKEMAKQVEIYWNRIGLSTSERMKRTQAACISLRKSLNKRQGKQNRVKP